MEHAIYKSIEDVAKPETFSKLVGKNIGETCLTSFEPLGWSSTESSFLAIDGCEAETPQYMFKRLRKEHDWVMTATDDRNWRAILVWSHGLLDRLPGEIEHGIIGCTIDEDGYAILMHNLSRTLLRDDISISLDDHKFILRSIAKFHATFWNSTEILESKYNLCKPENFFTHTSPEKAGLMKNSYPAFIQEMIIEGHKQIGKFIDSDLAAVFHKLVRDSSQLCNKLSAYPYTLVHSDIRRANLGILREEKEKLVMLDWARPTVTAPGVDLIYYLQSLNLIHLPISIQDSIEIYKQSLADLLGQQFDESWWKPQLELSILGVVATMGCFTAYFAANSESVDQRRDEIAQLEFWADQAVKGMKRLN